MDGETDRLDARKLGGEAIGGGNILVRDAELVALASGRDAIMAADVDIGIDPDRDRHRATGCRCDGTQPPQFRHRLDVELMDVASDRAFELGPRLADAGEDDPLGRDAGGERALQLASGDDIRSGAELGKNAEYGEI